METELKTLKDMEWLQADINKPEITIKLNELKAEAVKWIKDMREGTSFKPIPMAQKEFIAHGDPIDIAQNCFKCFFNLTEEDLK